MKTNKKSKSPIQGPAEREQQDGDPFFQLTNAAAATECTGLIQVPPDSEDDLENYNAVYNFTKTHATAPQQNQDDLPNNPDSSH